jgi:phage baseplate assembly protein gpV
MNILLNAIKAHATALDSRQGEARFGIVTSVDTTKAMAKVNLQPEDVLTGWLPLLSAWTGSGWGMVCPPSPGDQVLVIPQEGDAEHGVIIGRVFSNSQHAPVAPVGELWLIHASGSSIILSNNGTIQIVGDLHVQGEVFDKHGSMSQFRSIYDNHIHVDSRREPTSVPNAQA